MVVNIEGHHGTSIESAKLIVKSNYKMSLGDQEWLGDGVYFFIEGISQNPRLLAKKWALATAWDSGQQNYKFSNYCILKSDISVDNDNLLDLTKPDGVEVFEYLVEKFESKIKTIGRKLKYSDGLIINAARCEGIIPIDVVIGNFYIKFTKERINRINLRTSNCTICTVFEPNKNITSIKILEIGTVK